MPLFRSGSNPEEIDIKVNLPLMCKIYEAIILQTLTCLVHETFPEVEISPAPNCMLLIKLRDIIIAMPGRGFVKAVVTLSQEEEFEFDPHILNVERLSLKINSIALPLMNTLEVLQKSSGPLNLEDFKDSMAEMSRITGARFSIIEKEPPKE